MDEPELKKSIFYSFRDYIDVRTEWELVCSHLTGDRARAERARADKILLEAQYEKILLKG